GGHLGSVEITGKGGGRSRICLNRFVRILETGISVHGVRSGQISSPVRSLIIGRRLRAQTQKFVYGERHTSSRCRSGTVSLLRLMTGMKSAQHFSKIRNLKFRLKKRSATVRQPFRIRIEIRTVDAIRANWLVIGENVRRLAARTWPIARLNSAHS